MKKFVFTMLMLSIFAVFSESTFAQTCDRTRLTPIKCGYYEEGYQDGVNEARLNAASNYRKYNSKLDRQYESFYKSGYDDGYASIRPFSRWTDRQKNTYDQGFDDGSSDSERNISRLPARYEGQYDRDFEQYYQRGYIDGYDQRPKRYDEPIGTTVPNPRPTPRPGPILPNPRGNRRGTTTGSAIWNGRVDNRLNISIKGNQLGMRSVAGPFNATYQNMVGVLPRRSANVTVRKLAGRGTVFVTQQPNSTNDYTAVVQISDPDRGMGDYKLQIFWTAVEKFEPYSSGKITWKGRVDHTVSLRIFGETVESNDDTGTGLSSVSYDMEGYLASRPGSVRIRKKDGRGNVYIVEQPSEANDYTAVIRIFDGGGGADNYEIDIEW